ncbi:MAG: aminoglycoside phosphotransferase family protein [Pseudomonadota bacterium]
MSTERLVSDFLIQSGLVKPGMSIRMEPLTGGVSSDIWMVELANQKLCVKRALEQLKVAAEWTAPMNRNSFEWEWLRFASKHIPGHVPVPLARDDAAGFFAMEFLAPSDHPVWKTQLLHGEVSTSTAQAVGFALSKIHAASAHSLEVASKFDSIENFHALRLEPYLLATAKKHPDLADALQRLAVVTAGTQRALVHGDISPKNILVGPNGPIILDAECAWYGDPAFDLAFCLNHLLLKSLPVPGARVKLANAYQALVTAYLAGVSWEDPARLEARTAHLLPGLFLARVDGKSPVEYVTDPAQKDMVRDVASRHLRTPTAKLIDILASWEDKLTHVG